MTGGGYGDNKVLGHQSSYTDIQLSRYIGNGNDDNDMMTGKEMILLMWKKEG